MKKRITRFLLGILTAISLAATTPFAAMAAETDAVTAPANDSLLLVYTNQEGMSKVTSTINGRAFNYTAECKTGDYVICKLEVYPGCSFSGWYVNGELATVNKDYSFTVKNPCTVVEARMRVTGDFLRKTNNVSMYNWTNQTTRFAPGYGKYDYAVTTRFMGKPESVIPTIRHYAPEGTVERCYNITVTAKNGEQNITDFYSPMNMVFKIPTELKAPGRVFKMALMGDGTALVLDDLDNSDDTVTFQTRFPGVFTLISY